MGRRPALRAYKSVSLPVDLVTVIERVIAEDQSHSYTSVPDFIVHVVRRAVDEHDVNTRAAKLGERLDQLKPDVDRAAAKIRAGGPRGKFCHKCGKAIPADAAFCSSCGTPVG